MSAGVLERHARLFRERFDGLLSLAQQVEQLEPLRTRDGMSNPSELRVEGVFQLAVCHTRSAGMKSLDSVALTFYRVCEHATGVKKSGFEP